MLTTKRFTEEEWDYRMRGCKEYAELLNDNIDKRIIETLNLNAAQVAMWERNQRAYQLAKKNAEDNFVRGLRAGVEFRSRYQHYAIPSPESIAAKFIEDSGLDEATRNGMFQVADAFADKIRAKADKVATLGATNHMLAIHFLKHIKRFSTQLPIERNMQWLSIA